MTNALPDGKLNHERLNELLADIVQLDERMMIAPGIGHDAAGMSFSGHYLSFTTDPITFSTNRLGTYSVAVNINDICCLGCKPIWFSTTLLLPSGATETELRSIWTDLITQLNFFSIQLIGGHVEITHSVNQPVLIGQMIGEPVNEQFIDITQCRPGDQLLLYQPVAIEGTATLAYEKQSELARYFSKAQIKAMQHLLDDPGICLWPFVRGLLNYTGIRGLHDPTEGGLATALHEVAHACGCGLMVHEDSIPILQSTRQLAQIYHFDPLGLLASGSLIIVCSKEVSTILLTDLGHEPISFIGELTNNTDVVLQTSLEARALPRYEQDQIAKLMSYD